MRVSGVNNKIAFTAGKIDLYSDFDGTYCPATHASLHIPNENGYMISYCDKMKNFLNATRDDLHFNLTTGRTLGEYESISWLLKMRDFKLPFPQTVITKDGSDKFVKMSSDDDFYLRNKFPFDYNSPQKDKELDIKNLTNWDGDKIHAELKNLTDKYHIKLIEADSQNSVSDYGEKSLFSKGKLNPDEWKKLPLNNGKIQEHKTPIAEYVLGSRNDGKLKFNLIFPPDYGFCPDRNWIYDNFVGDLKKYLDSQKIQYHIDWEPADETNHHRISCSITPKIEDRALTKLYDTKKALKQAIKNNDIVIAAGDGSNDFDMLNPLEYLDKDFVKSCEENSSHKDFYKKDMQEKFKDLQKVYSGENNPYINGLRKELSENGYLKKIEDLPIYGIVMKKKDSKLQSLIDTFARINKIIVADFGGLDDGIKKVIKIHAEKNKAFNTSMSENLYTLIFGAKKKSGGNYKSIKAVTGLILASLSGYAGYHFVNRKKGNDNGSNTNIKSSNK